MPKLVDTAAQRRAIRRAAHRVFARRGVKGTGLAHVADAVGMARSSLYHYYPDKEALVRDLLAELLADEEAVFASVAGGEGGHVERIEELIRTMIGMLKPWSAVGRVLLELRANETRRFRGFFKRIRGYLGSAIADGQRDGEIASDVDPSLAAATLIAMLDGLFLQHLVEAAAFPDDHEIADEVVRYARKMLAP